MHIFSGERTLQITAVDVELMELVKSWLIYAVVRAPNVTKGYQVTIPIGQSRTVNKVKLQWKSFLHDTSYCIFYCCFC